jgi:hypothetical protein
MRTQRRQLIGSCQRRQQALARGGVQAGFGKAISASSDDGEISAAALATAQGLFTLQSFTSRLQVWT